MHRFLALILASSPAAMTLSVHAAPLSYLNPGSPAPFQVITAAASGTIYGTFVSSDAGGEDTVRLFDVTANTYSAFLLDNRASAPGDMASFGTVNAGDLLVFQVRNNDVVAPGSYYASAGHIPEGSLLASDAAYSPDGIGHGYSVPFAGGQINGMTFAAGTYIGMEDLPELVSDLDYNDINFIFSDVSFTTPSPVPEPSSLVLLGTGVMTAAGLLRQRITRSR